MSNVIPNFFSTLATQAVAHPLEAAGGVIILGGLTVAACKISMTIQRFAVGFFSGLILGTLFVASNLAKVGPFVKVEYDIPVIALVILGSGLAGGFGMFHIK